MKALALTLELMARMAIFTTVMALAFRSFTQDIRRVRTARARQKR